MNYETLIAYKVGSFDVNTPTVSPKPFREVPWKSSNLKMSRILFRSSSIFTVSSEVMYLRFSFRLEDSPSAIGIKVWTSRQLRDSFDAHHFQHIFYFCMDSSQIFFPSDDILLTSQLWQNVFSRVCSKTCSRHLLRFVINKTW